VTEDKQPSSFEMITGPPAGPIANERLWRAALGDDPDPFMRLQIWRDLGGHFEGGRPLSFAGIAAAHLIRTARVLDRPTRQLPLSPHGCSLPAFLQSHDDGLLWQTRRKRGR
jgi:hypothetical protein